MAARQPLVEIHEVSEKEYQESLKVLYRNPEAVHEVFEEGIAQQEKALKEFEVEVAKDPRLRAEVFQEPIGALRRRGLLGPFDRVRLDLQHAGGAGVLAWPFPDLLDCHWECRSELRWVCVRVHKVEYCFQYRLLTCTRRCRDDD